ncbi:hypothetical protein COU00_03600 [Candidatus Falkowbacteria bacterium CG10_big_fil_rev_8_21_14_0_10_43_11]|uniref:Glycosyltransferase subfamily 4-like N-terminal domain-containing protein n=1 Tax=Candidatus Falkowbacteria bacterium CG10_big_fil_rev_8_21_14_0_10_43_11 TaxID=1974568 RepID=A0A2M6WLJ0_9BACT|nr:MAG: hypothetical protein COU00_03600 [Candidatus Falkowbacteria bacterium CG10_big_fil_rev_8_21_14_0_10_43_11]
MLTGKKILIVTPRFPLPAKGACEQDRLAGMLQLKNLGCEVMGISKIFSWQDQSSIQAFAQKNGIVVQTAPYQTEAQKTLKQKLFFYGRRLINPLFWDGAAYEYSHRGIKEMLAEVIAEYRPDLVWFDYTYLWPLYGLTKKRGIPIITRSLNFEPSHFIQEDGWSIINFFKAIAKCASEYLMAKDSNVIFSITPQEEKIYNRFFSKRATNLPLRGLPKLIKAEREISDKKILDVFFMGSTYNVVHNRRALELVIKYIAPLAEKIAPNRFIFHVSGGKFPAKYRCYLNGKIIYHGYVADLDEFLAKMDIALIPSIFGAGMQQKIFEPLVRGIPLITSRRGIAVYPFNHAEHLLFAGSAEDFVKCLLKMQAVELRRILSLNAIRLSQKLFSQEALDAIIINQLNKL